MNLGGINLISIEIECVCNGGDGELLETNTIQIPTNRGGLKQLLVVIVLKEEKIIKKLHKTSN